MRQSLLLFLITEPSERAERIVYKVCTNKAEIFHYLCAKFRVTLCIQLFCCKKEGRILT